MTLLPTPQRVEYSDGTLPLPAPLTWHTDADGVDAVSVLQERLAPATSFRRVAQEQDAFLRIRFDDALPKEGYRLDIRDRIDVVAADRQGAGWAIQTLLQLLPVPVFGPGPLQPEELAWPRVTVEDAPRFSWRGSHLDVARHFLPVEFVLRWLDVMALHKLNLLHLHLTDDQGWRLPVPGYPRLTDVGAWRPGTIRGHQPEPDPVRGQDVDEHDGIPHGGAYTVGDIRAIVERARQLGITVMPEVDMPGHMEAAIAAYPELASCDHVRHPRVAFGISHHVMNLTDEAIRFCETVIDTVLELFPDSPIHLGGDEAPGDHWFSHPPTKACLDELGITTAAGAQAWFEDIVCRRVLDAGRRVVVWDEVLEHGAPEGVTVMVWRDAQFVQRAVEAGFDTIAAPYAHTYFDYGESTGEHEPISIVAPTTLDDVAAYHRIWDGLDSPRLLGGQFQLWSEYLRTGATVEYFGFPRGALVAEQLWAGMPKVGWGPEDLAVPTARLTAMGINWRRFD
ncbi:MAG: family 20 glycosylhydrolase [Propionibacterium sp.]|nr:family 20 glycosylhydrolase [Propionibacterium sp.]